MFKPGPKTIPWHSPCLAEDGILDFVERRLGFHPDPHQRLLLTSTAGRVIVNCTRQWGKTTVSAARAVHRAHTVRDSLIVIACRNLRQSGEWMKRAAAMQARLGIAPRGDGTNRPSLIFENGSRIVGLPDAEAGIRGFTASMLIVDAAARVSDETYYNSLRPMLSTTNGELWMLSTPCGKRGFFHETWARGGPEWLKVSVPATGCPRISTEFLDDQRAVMTDEAFRQEHMCEFIGSGDALFDPDLIEGAYDDDLDPI